MAGAAQVTIDHDEIKQFVEDRGGYPACVKGTGSKSDPGLLRIDFPGGAGEQKLQHISWDEFFEKFDENELAFLYQKEKKDGEPSTFVKFVKRGEVH